MPVQTESNRINDFLKFEEGIEKYYSREEVLVEGGVSLVPGSVIGKVSKSGPTTGTAGTGNTGNGTCTDVSLGPNAQIGTYTLLCIASATNGGTFEVQAPDGTTLGQAKVGVAYTNPHINFTLNDGATDFAVGDTFTIAVTAGSGKVKPIDFSAVDGTQDACGISLSTVTPPTTQRSLAFTSGGEYEIRPGDVIVGATGGATARVVSVTVSSGAWGDGDAAGTLILDGQAGTFQSENLDVRDEQNVATIAGNSSAHAPALPAAAVMRDAIIDPEYLVWPVGATLSQIAAALAQLEARGIIRRSNA